MSKKTKQQKQHQLKQAQKGELPLPEAIEVLKEQILEEVKLCAIGAKTTIYELFEMGKQLKHLEDEFEKQADAQNDGADSNPPQPNAGDF